MPRDQEERRRQSDAVVEEALMDEGTSERQAVAIVRAHATWNDWFMHDMLRYWYLVGALAFVGMVVMAVAQEWHVKDAAGILGLVLLAGTIIVGEMMVYMVLWPEGALTQDRTFARKVRRFWRRVRLR